MTYIQSESGIQTGLNANIPTLDIGEQYYATDTDVLHIGTPNGNKNITPAYYTTTITKDSYDNIVYNIEHVITIPAKTIKADMDLAIRLGSHVHLTANSTSLYVNGGLIFTVNGPTSGSATYYDTRLVSVKAGDVLTWVRGGNGDMLCRICAASIGVGIWDGAIGGGIPVTIPSTDVFV
jgi:hypothetical protein